MRAVNGTVKVILKPKYLVMYGPGRSTYKLVLMLYCNKEKSLKYTVSILRTG